MKQRTILLNTFAVVATTLGVTRALLKNPAMAWVGGMAFGAMLTLAGSRE